MAYGTLRELKTAAKTIGARPAGTLFAGLVGGSADVSLEPALLGRRQPPLAVRAVHGEVPGERRHHPSVVRDRSGHHRHVQRHHLHLALADRLRQVILDAGYVLEDSKERTIVRTRRC